MVASSMREGTRDDTLADIAQSSDVVDTRAVAHDLWPRRLIERRELSPVTLPARVLWPRNDDDVVRIVHAARKAHVPLVPFGAGSGVVGGVSPTSSSWILDMKRMSRVVSIDDVTRTVIVEAGMIGERLEQWLNAHGFTLGHFPSSLYCSTVGGWVATRSAGQLSSRFGKIEDMVVGLEGVDGRGERISAHINDARTGPASVQMLVGSEGALVVVTRVHLRVVPLASHRWLRAFTFDDLPRALNAQRALMSTGEAPSVLRLYDPLDSAIAGALHQPNHEPDRIVAGGIARAGLEHSGPTSTDEPTLYDVLAERVDDLALFTRPRAARRVVGEILGRPQLTNAILDRWHKPPRLIVGIEGEPDVVAARASSLRRALTILGGKDAGDEPGTRWLHHRHRVGYRMSRAFAAGSWVDTFEVATGWEKAAALHKDMREVLRDTAIVMCHFSHAYLDGCALYFTLAGGGADGSGPRSALARYDLAWERALATVRRHGATISHHHGVGRSKAKSLRLAPGAKVLLEKLKDALDPDRILNPGVLGLHGRGGVP